ncbi:MAG: hypothetical protein V4555_11285 [Acidobacteriota bacterium]
MQSDYGSKGGNEGFIGTAGERVFAAGWVWQVCGKVLEFLRDCDGSIGVL